MLSSSSESLYFIMTLKFLTSFIVKVVKLKVTLKWYLFSLPHSKSVKLFEVILILLLSIWYNIIDWIKVLLHVPSNSSLVVFMEFTKFNAFE